ncbi:MAG: hypothetical protein R3F39_20770 [Myxococcota bacterium]
MEIKITIDDRIVTAAKRLITKRRLMVAGGLAVLASAVALAAPLGDVPNKFSDGNVLSAGELNANFSTVVEAIDVVAAAVDEGITFQGPAGVYTENRGFCGATAPTGPWMAKGLPAPGGWKAVNTLCETACGTPGAHLCTPTEVLRSIKIGYLPGPGAGYAGRVAATTMGWGDDDPSNGVGNCQEWTGNGFSSWWSKGGGFTRYLCDTTDQVFLCCD